VGSAPWDTEKYLNIWICDLSVNGRDALLGYAYPPTGSEFWDSIYYRQKAMQGVGLDVSVVDSITEEERAIIVVHEVGHFFGLRHIFGDGGCGQDDFIDDTPLAGSPFGNYRLECDYENNSCIESNGREDFPNMVENYMDYSPPECHCMFTQEQARVMRYGLIELRSSLGFTLVSDDSISLDSEDVKYVWGPNPYVQGLTIDFEALVDGYSLELYSISGKLVYEKRLSRKENVVLFLGDIANGLYVLCLKDEKREVVQKDKLIVSR
jgi:hypothetical protein